MPHKFSSDNLKKIDVVILSGGQGIRMRKVIRDRPKPMVEINQRPFLDTVINYVWKYGFRRFILCVGYMAEVIQSYYIKKAGPQEILFSYEDKPLGTGGAVKNAEKLILSNPFLVMNGDSFCAVDLLQFFGFHLKKGALVSIVVAGAEDSEDYGLVTMDNSGRIMRFAEKEREREKAFINAGIYLFKKDILSLIPAPARYSLERDLFPKLVGQEFYGHITEEELIDIGTPERYEQARRYFCE